VPKSEEQQLKEFGVRLATIRKERSMSQEKLAWEAGVGDNQIGRIERGEVNPSLRQIFRICKALKIEAKDLF
jgi:transcriptional regulator with XRE-family HTH domain